MKFGCETRSKSNTPGIGDLIHLGRWMNQCVRSKNRVVFYTPPLSLVSEACFGGVRGGESGDRRNGSWKNQQKIVQELRFIFLYLIFLKKKRRNCKTIHTTKFAFLSNSNVMQHARHWNDIRAFFCLGVRRLAKREKSKR